MSTTEGRKQRIERLLKCLNQHPTGLEANEIAHKTQLLTEITMDRLYKYLAELEWAGMLIQQDLKYTVIRASSIKFERERKTKIETQKGKAKALGRDPVPS